MPTMKFNAAFAQANAYSGRYRVMMGGAGSGKSVNVAQDFVLKLMDKRYKGANLLCIRKVEASCRDSMYAELVSAIKTACGSAWRDVWEIKQCPLYLRCKVTGNSVLFRGLGDREKLKSINVPHGKLCWIWCEEATELTSADVELLDDRLRGELPQTLFYQITFTFNPISSTHWLKSRFFDCELPNAMVHHSTFLSNAFIDEGYAQRMLERKSRDKEGYNVYALGQWGESGGNILTSWEVKQFDTDRGRFDGVAIGQDFGFNHPNAILTLGIKDAEIFVCAECVLTNMDTAEIIRYCEGKLMRDCIMWCDSAEPDRIKMWRNAGYCARAVKKGAGSVAAQIDYLKGVRLVISPSCVHLIKELQGWKWQTDSNGTYIDQPVDVFDDAIAALRYGVEGWRKLGNVNFL